MEKTCAKWTSLNESYAIVDHFLRYINYPQRKEYLAQSVKRSFVIFIFLISSSHFIVHLQQQILAFTLVHDWHDWIYIFLYRFFVILFASIS